MTQVAVFVWVTLVMDTEIRTLVTVATTLVILSVTLAGVTVSVG